MTKKQEIISNFIQSFFNKAQTNSRHNKNTILNLVELTKRSCELYLDEKYDFTEDEILEGFNENGFTILKPKDKVVLVGKTNKGMVEFSDGYHINVNSQNISDLVSSLRKGLPLKSNPDTILRINKLKESLKQFAKNHN